MVVVAQLAVAVVIGLLIPHVADLSIATRTADGVISSETEITKQFNDDGWLIVLGGAAGLVLGLVLQVTMRTHEVITLVAIVLGALLAALMAGWIAMSTGPADPVRVLAEARPGTTAPLQVVIDARAAYLVWPFTAVLSALTVLLAASHEQRDDADGSVRTGVRGATEEDSV